MITQCSFINKFRGDMETFTNGDTIDVYLTFLHFLESTTSSDYRKPNILRLLIEF